MLNIALCHRRRLEDKPGAEHGPHQKDHHAGGEGEV